MAQTLEEVLTELGEEAKVLAKYGDERGATLIKGIVKRVRDAAEDYLTWLSEGDAQLWTGHSAAWLRARFAEWERGGHAKKERGRRYYRAVVLPHRANLSAAYADGRAAGEAAARRARG